MANFVTVVLNAGTTLAQFELFTLKTKVRFEKGGVSTPDPPPGCATGSYIDIDDVVECRKKVTKITVILPF